MEDFIRQQVRRVLAEANRETGVLGRTTEQIKEFGTLAESNPAKIAQNFNFSDFSPGGVANKDKAASFLRYLANNDNELMAIIAGVKVEGADIKVFPKKLKYSEEEKEEPAVPTGRLARYVGALLIAAAGIGKIKFEKEKRRIMHSKGEYVIIKNI